MTKLCAMCGAKFYVGASGSGRALTCSQVCSGRLRVIRNFNYKKREREQLREIRLKTNKEELK